MHGRVLIVAGSDSGGGAGIQADLKTVTALRAYGATAVTALTAQDTRGVAAVMPVPPDFIARQMELVLTFNQGSMVGSGRDRYGAFSIDGAYQLSDGLCVWVKQYIGKHSLHYRGYNEGKGIWGTWEWSGETGWHGGFHIWPVAMGNPTQLRLAEELEEPTSLDVETLEVSGAEVVRARREFPWKRCFSR